jgi:hypothetical protein
VPSGSLARGTQLDPIHDVDLVVVYDADHHPDWDGGPGSAELALEHTRKGVNRLLSVNGGTYGAEVRFTTLRNHVVKCFLDDPDDPDAFAVEVMPALRQNDETLRVPERRPDQWTTADPEYLMKVVAKRHGNWRHFAPMVRVLKSWKNVHGLAVKSLTMEVLALNHLPDGDRSEALARFFNAAAGAVMMPICDPAGHCGEIQPDLDRYALRAALLETADVANRARDAERNGDNDTAVCLWRSVLGKTFPEPPGGCSSGGASSIGGSAVGVAAIGAPAMIVKQRLVKDAPQG